MSTKKEMAIQVSYGYLVHVYNLLVESIRAALTDSERALKLICNTCRFIVTENVEHRKYLRMLSQVPQLLEWEVDKVRGVDVWTQAFYRKQYRGRLASYMYEQVLDKFMRRLEMMNYFHALQSIGLFDPSLGGKSGSGERREGLSPRLSSRTGEHV